MRPSWRRRGARPPQPPVTDQSQQMMFSRRATLLAGGQMAVGGLLLARMGYISLIDGDRYALEAESNRLNLTLIPPRRGWIIDRYGKALADNRVALRVDIVKDRLRNKSEVLARLGELLGLDADELDRIERDLRSAAGAQPVEVASGLSEDDYGRVSVHLPELPGVIPARGFIRNYPAGPSVAHLIGYVGAASADDYKRERDPLMLTPGYKVGKDGLEKDYDLALKGRPGARRAEVTASGKLVRELSTQEDEPGSSLQLTIDADLQDYAARRMGIESGSMVVIDTLTGGILALVSMPAFDPNSFTDGIGALEWKMLREDERIPLLNKAMRGLYPPGSTLKPMAAIALQMHGVDPRERVHCPGGYRLGNRFFRCLGTHGSVDMRTAIAQSCNTYFYAMAHRVGYDAIAPVARAFGLGQEFDLPGTSQRYGTIPDSAWKQRRYKQAWTASDSLNATIGQGYVSVSPLQLAMMAARIASGRQLPPQLLLGAARETQPFDIPAEYFDAARDGMAMVVAGGTGRRSALQLDNVQMAGKTGTAQVRAGGRGSGKGGAWRSRDHGLFVCYAPVENPRYAAAVVIEHGMGGARAAAPVAKDVFTFLYDREQAMSTLLTLEAGWGGTPTERLQRRYIALKGSSSSIPSQAPPNAPVAAVEAAQPATAPSAPPAVDASGAVTSPDAADSSPLPLPSSGTLSAPIPAPSPPASPAAPDPSGLMPQL